MLLRSHGRSLIKGRWRFSVVRAGASTLLGGTLTGSAGREADAVVQPSVQRPSPECAKLWNPDIVEERDVGSAYLSHLGYISWNDSTCIS